MKKSIFIGNGINRLGNVNNSWENLLCELINGINKREIIITDNKPFPMLYEEIVLRGKKFSGITESKIKNKVCCLMDSLQFNEIHKQIIELDIDDIITTNYDYNFEKCIDNDFDRKFYIEENGADNDDIRKLEKKYRLYTHSKIDNKRIWHIHGDVGTDDSIVLGQDMYSRVLDKYINYFKKKDKKYFSWIDLLFNTEVHIIGFGLEYTEIDIWWLLNYRARLINSDRYEYKPKNKIYYYIKSEGSDEKFKSKKQLLESQEVEVKYIDCKNYNDFYYQCIQIVNNS